MTNKEKDAILEKEKGLYLGRLVSEIDTKIVFKIDDIGVGRYGNIFCTLHNIDAIDQLSTVTERLDIIKKRFILIDN